MKEPYLLEIVQKYKNQAWIGTRPPFNMDIVDLLNCTNFRLATKYHQKYDVIWMYEHMVSDLRQNGWRLVFDEIIRMINGIGIVVIRSQECKSMTIVKIKNFFYRRFGIKVKVEHEDIDKEKMIWTLVLKIERLYIKEYNSKLWTFAMLTGGKKEETVIEFLKSIRKGKNGSSHEIIIAGPRSKNYDQYDVKYLNLESFRDNEFAEISRKKNAIADIAKNSNLLIAHDRYVLNDDFFSGFEKFGYDFDFLTIKQYYETGKEFPSYCCRRSADLIWTTPYKIDNYNQYYDSQYINGGLMIFKTNTLKNIRFNDLLMWNQMEDVEVCKEFTAQGIVSRINFLSSAKTIGIDEKYTSTFQKVPRKLEKMINPVAMDLREEVKGHLFYSQIASLLPYKFKQKKIYLKIRKILIGR
jgi:hypothetical protein